MPVVKRSMAGLRLHSRDLGRANGRGLQAGTGGRRSLRNPSSGIDVNILVGKSTGILCLPALFASLESLLAMTETVIWLTLLLLLVVANAAALWRFGRSTHGRPILRALVILAITSACVLGLAVFPLLLIYRAYSIPTNAMAPTLKGRHYVGTCPHCSGPTVVSFQEDPHNGSRQVGETGICARCLQVGPAQNLVETPRSGDHIIVRRLATPRRWDLVVFLFPGDRRQVYVKRLVGLPGESVEVKEGGIWIDGVRQEPPPEIANLRWFLPDEPYAEPRPEFAAEGNPTQLADDEYFVLGDYSPQSYDSRFWGPVPAEDMRGVVGAVYLPPQSARVLPQH
jgi:signal peptidase I